MEQKTSGQQADTGATRTVQVEGKVVDQQRTGKLGIPHATHADVLNTRVGSEASQESGLQPVEATLGGIAGATEIRNKDIKKRHDDEMVRRGRRNREGAEVVAGSNEVSLGFTGLMMVEVDGEKAVPVSGSFSGQFNEKIVLRRATEAEVEEMTAARGPAPTAGDKTLVKGSGVGGGGNPQHARDSTGVASNTAERQQPGQGVVGGGRTSRN